MIDLSVVIRTKDSSATLAQCLDGLRRQVGPPFEIVVVDSGSKDTTLELARTATDRIVRIPAERFSYGVALNEGFAAARGACLCSLSSHCVLQDPSALDRLSSAVRESEPGVVAGFGQARFADRPETAGADGNWREGILKISGEEFARNRTRGLRNPFSVIKRTAWEETPFTERRCEDQHWAAYFLSSGRSVLDVRSVSYRYLMPYPLSYYVRKHRDDQVEMHAMAPSESLARAPVARYHVRGALDLLRQAGWRWSRLPDPAKWYVSWALGMMWARCRLQGLPLADTRFAGAVLRVAVSYAARNAWRRPDTRVDDRGERIERNGEKGAAS